MKTPYSLLFVLLLAVWGACDSPDSFYQELEDTPELFVSSQYSYRAAYQVGDTLFLYGRLNPLKNMRVQVGDARALIVVIERVRTTLSNPVTQGENYMMDKVGFIITREMGLGLNRPITITTGGNTIQGPPIEIYAPRDNGYPEVPLRLVPHYSRPGATFLNSVNGKGTLYIYANRNFVRITKSGDAVTLVDSRTFSDNYGVFSIATFYSGAVDSRERTLYFSALTTDPSPENADSYIYRFCAYDLVTGMLTTHNRTVLPRDIQQQTLEAYRPFEGQIGTIKLTKVQQLYADSLGGTYMRLGDYAICRMSPAGEVKYLFKTAPWSTSYPLVWDDLLGQQFEIEEKTMPGILLIGGATAVAKSTIDPDGSRLYLYSFSTQSGGKSTIQAYDVNDQIALNKWQTPFDISSDVRITGPFSSLSGVSDPGDMLGRMPLPADRLLVLWYQNDMNINPALPLWGVLDFAAERGEQYAPGACNMGPYKLDKDNDLLLNYDEDGNLYMTANNKLNIVKTEP